MSRLPIGHTSQKMLQLKEYLDGIRSKSKNKEYKEIRQSQCSPKIHKTFKKQSQTQTQELIQLEHRFLQLEDKYKQLLQKARIKNKEHEQLRQQIKYYQKIHQRDTEEIQRLRCILGFIKKKSVETQVSEEQIQWNHHFRNSRLNKFDQSTEDDIKLKQSAEAFHAKEHHEPTRFQTRYKAMKLSRQKSQQKKSQKGLLQQYERELKGNKDQKPKRLSNSPYSQLRFVPSRP